MTLNVNYNGKHIGFVARSYPENKHLFMVALTSLRIEEVAVDMEQIKGYLGKTFGFTNLFGRLNEGELHKFVESKRLGKYEEVGIGGYEDFLRFFFLKTVDERGYKIEELFDLEELIKQITGYLLIDVEHVVITENTIQLKEEINYLSEKILSGGDKPIFAVVIDYPIFRTDTMGLGEGFLLGANFSDFGGRNHAHETELKIQSGNYEKVICLPIQMHVRKGMPIQLYLQEDKIKRIFCNGAIYEF
jgi:hypothetical protein